MVGGWEWHQPRRRTPAAASAAPVPPNRTAATAATGVGRRDQAAAAAAAADGWESDVEDKAMAPSHLRAGGGASAHRAGNAAARGKYNSSRKHYSNQKYHNNHYNYHRPSQQEQPVPQYSAAAATAASAATAAADDDDGTGDGDDGDDDTEDIDEYINRSTSGQDSGSDENGSDQENIVVEFTVVQAPFSLLDLLQACAGEDDEEATTLIASAAAARGGGDGGAHRRVIGWSGEEADEEDDEDEEDTDSSQYLSHQQQHFCQDHDHDRKHNHNYHHHHYHRHHHSSAGEPRGYFNASHFFAPAHGHYQHPAVTELVDSDEEDEIEVTRAEEEAEEEEAEEEAEEEEAEAAEEEEHQLQHQPQLDPWEVSPPTPHSATSTAPLISHAEPSPPTPLSPRPLGRVFEIFDDDDDDDILAEDEDENDEHDEHDGQVEAEQEQEQEQQPEQERRRRHQQQQTRAHHLLRPPLILTTAAAGTDTHQHPRPISLLPSQRHRRAAVNTATAAPPVPAPTMSQFPPPSRRPSSPTSVRFNEPLPQMQSSAVRAATKIGAMRRERALSAGRITPGVDDTPHIQYALAALTRDSDREFAESAAPAGNDGVGGAEAGPSHITAATAAAATAAEAGIGHAPGQRRHQPRQQQQQQQPPHPQQQQQQPTHQQQRLDHVHREWRPSTATHHPHRQQAHPVEPNSPEREERIRNLFRQNSEGADSSRHPGHGAGAGVGVGAHPPHHHNFGVDRLISVTELDLFATDPSRQKYPRLDRKPRILHTSWLLTLMGLILLIVGALVTAVVLAGSRPTGLAPYSGSIYSMQFFLFRILPQAAAATVFMFAQSVTVASFRAAPFAAMAEEDAYRRFGALFVTMYPPSFLWPHLAGPWELKAGALAGWPLLITLPLASASFSVVYVDGQWYWSAVRAVVWTWVALYFVYLAGLAVVLMFWHDRVTGLMWDVRSLADLVPLISQQPPCDDYAGTQGLARRRQIMTHLHHKFVDRLGYWTRAGRSGGDGGDGGAGPVERRQGAQGGGDVFYGMGKPWAAREVRRSAFGTILGRRVSFGRDLDPDELDQPTSANAVRYRYLPWCLRSGPLIVSTVVAAALLLALIVVSFRPGTSLALGFPPEVPAGPRAGAFSAANFLWSFVPALVGTILMAAFQTLDLRLRILKPWAELARVGGGTARESLLLDYAACLPFEAALKAASNRHWRVAFVSLVGGLSVFVPVLAGGVFMALTVDGTGGEVRMFANMAVFGVLVSLLALYLVGLMTLIPFRIQFGLPHPVDCPAEVISFLADPKLLADPAFDGPRSRADLLGRLDGRAVVPRRGHGDDGQTRWVFEVDGGNTNPRGRLGVRRAAEKGWVV